MRVAPEAVDHRLVPALEPEALLEARGGEERHGLLVHRGGLTVHVRHVQEAALLNRQLAIDPRGHGVLRERQGQRIVSEGGSGAAMDVA